ncbi:DUF1631 family protein [Roseateles chitosanitabidus]|uniref:DUF1631 family protein n=1 Tax=Roseateles chitosanitabidus TaxID=65048 RepID=UPI0008354444|nr:DUF1631 family protein [Roseateles chitosanitabidus]MBO9689531.1 DUF1631 family protein [Roseateles chitosanitabidus]
MNRLNPHVDVALQRVRTAAEQAAERGAEGLGLAALSAGQAKRRDALLSAQFLFRKHQALFSQRFDQSMRQQAAEVSPAATAAAPASTRSGAKATQWDELSLMDDDQVNAMVATDRIGLALGHQSEWELREVNAYMGDIPGVSDERHPLRPQAIAQALLEGVNAVSDDPETRQILTDELTRALALEMRACYADIAGLFRSRGLRPQDLRVRGAGGPGGARGAGGTTSGVPLHDSRYATMPGALPGNGYGSRAGGLHSVAGGFQGSGHGAHGMPSGHGGHGGFGGGSVDPQLMDLLRRLAQSPSGGLGGPTTGGGLPPNSQWQGWEVDPGAGGYVDGGPIVLPPNLIHLHRDELRQAASGSLDHMVIDVVAGLFDQILSDAKLPPLMAQQIARLQLPVLRAALGDRSFFSSRRHPVRRLVNRIATLAAAYDDFTDDPGKSFLTLVRELVQDVVSGDFDRMDLYESKLDQLDQFIADQTAQTLKSQGDAAALLERKETELRLQQRYMQQLERAMADMDLREFMREFLTRTWSEVLVHASRHPDLDAALVDRLRQMGRDLVLSVQPKTTPQQRQAFLASLPVLMRTLNDGLDLIRWPEPARKKFFAELLPAHAESLKGQALSPLEYNLLAKQLESVFGMAPPREQDLPAPNANAGSLDLDLTERLSDEEARRLGLVQDEHVDWDGQVDIDLSADEQPLAAVDISIDGLPAAEEAPAPTAGELLIDHLQIGVAYQMHRDGQWEKVRLAHISVSRSFFIFTHGQKHQQTLTMTARMLRKLCEAGRLRAFEHAHLLERATARARQQLAAIGAKA